MLVSFEYIKYITMKTFLSKMINERNEALKYGTPEQKSGL